MIGLALCIDRDASDKPVLVVTYGQFLHAVARCQAGDGKLKLGRSWQKTDFSRLARVMQDDGLLMTFIAMTS